MIEVEQILEAAPSQGRADHSSVPRRAVRLHLAHLRDAVMGRLMRDRGEVANALMLLAVALAVAATLYGASLGKL